MEQAVRALRAPTALIDRAEREDRLPPGSGLMLAFGLSFMFYAAIVATIA